VSSVVLLDAGPLGLITNPRLAAEAEECNRWLEAVTFKGIEVVIPEISDYEVRRELLRADKTSGIARLDGLKRILRYVPITTPVMLPAAHFWAIARKRGRKTADDASLDADVILAAQSVVETREGREGIIATTNVRHLELFSRARHWRTIG
jgi:predicted nucleic acid-binding protein